jgi:hypothetical protein
VGEDRDGRGGGGAVERDDALDFGMVRDERKEFVEQLLGVRCRMNSARRKSSVSSDDAPRTAYPSLLSTSAFLSSVSIPTATSRSTVSGCSPSAFTQPDTTAKPSSASLTGGGGSSGGAAVRRSSSGTFGGRSWTSPGPRPRRVRGAKKTVSGMTNSIGHATAGRASSDAEDGS